MKGTLKLSMLSLIVIILLTGCKADFDSKGMFDNNSGTSTDNLQSVDSKNNSPYSPPNRKIPEEGTIAIFESERTGIKAAAGIWVNEENIVVSDKEDHKLVVLDKEGNRIREIGKIGGGPLEFSNPTDIYHDEENGYLYVLDNGNKRVQILSENLEYLNEISLSDMVELTDPMNYSSVIADKEYLYISLNSASKGDLNIYRISAQGEINKTELICSGTLFKDGADIYIAEMMVFEFPESKNSPGMFDAIGGAGETYLYKLNGIKAEKIAPFPYMYTPCDVIKYKDTYYIASALWGLVESFKLEAGEFVYQKTLMPQISNDKVAPNSGYQMMLFDNTIYVTNSVYGDIYVIVLD